jgi:hypothetical protein
MKLFVRRWPSPEDGTVSLLSARQREWPINDSNRNSMLASFQECVEWPLDVCHHYSYNALHGAWNNREGCE